MLTSAVNRKVLPRWACLVNTIPLTFIAAILFAGMGAMNLGSACMFFGLYILLGKYNVAKQ